MTKILYVIFILVVSSVELMGQNKDTIIYYSQAMNYLNGKSSIGKPDENFSKIRVAPQIVPFDVLGWFFQSDLSNTIPGYTPKSSFGDSDYISNDNLEKFSNYKRESKCLVFFTSIRNNILLAEILKEHNSSDYLTASMFGQGIVFLFEYSDGKLKKVTGKKVHHN